MFNFGICSPLRASGACEPGPMDLFDTSTISIHISLRPGHTNIDARRLQCLGEGTSNFRRRWGPSSCDLAPHRLKPEGDDLYFVA